MTAPMTNEDFAFLNGETVTERITRICQEKGHSTYSVNGQITGICPRCGENTLSPNTAFANGQFPPGYSAPDYDPNSPSEQIEVIPDELEDIPAPEFTDRVLELADEVFTRVMDELQAGEWRPRFSELTEGEKTGIYRSLADAFSDETNE